MLSAFAGRESLAGTQCWRGWGYWVDGESRAYKSEEMHLVTRGPVRWGPGLAVELYHLDPRHGGIDDQKPPITIVPANPRSRYNGRTNYVDGLATVPDSADNIVFGMSQIGADSPALDEIQKYNRWACGLENASG